MSTETDIASQQGFRAAVNEGRLEAFSELVALDSIDHDGGPGQGPGPEGYRAFFTEMRTAFPDLHVEVDHLTAAEEDVAFAYTLTGTHSGPFQGHEPTGKSFSVRGVQISRFEGAYSPSGGAARMRPACSSSSGWPDVASPARGSSYGRGPLVSTQGSHAARHEAAAGHRRGLKDHLRPA